MERFRGSVRCRRIWVPLSVWIIIGAALLAVGEAEGRVGLTHLAEGPWAEEAYGNRGTFPHNIQVRWVPLQEGWNALVYTGLPRSMDEVLEQVPALNSLLRWDGPAQRFVSFHRELPPALNTLERLERGDVVWIEMAEGAVWTMDGVGDPPPVEVTAGWNFVSGPDVSEFEGDELGR